VLISHYGSLMPQALSEPSSEEKNRIFKMMHLQVLAQRDGTLIADGGCNVWPLPRWSFASSTPAFRFRAVLTGDGSEEVEIGESVREMGSKASHPDSGGESRLRTCQWYPLDDVQPFS
jgi:hypothetical protein